MSTYKKIHLEWVERLVPLRIGYKSIYLSTFSEKDDKSTIYSILKGLVHSEVRETKPNSTNFIFFPFIVSWNFILQVFYE